MARKTITTLTDDLDGSEAERTLTFSLDGTHYEIDLSAANIEAIKAAVEPFISAGRRSGRGAAKRSNSTGGGAKADLAGVRQWARKQGMEVSVRGRVSKQVMQAYQER